MVLSLTRYYPVSKLKHVTGQKPLQVAILPQFFGENN